MIFIKSVDKSNIGVCTLSFFYKIDELVRSEEESLSISKGGAGEVSIFTTPIFLFNRYYKALDFDIKGYIFFKFSLF